MSAPLFWNEERRRKLSEMSNRPMRELAQFFGKTPSSIKGAAQAYGISLKKHKPWTEEMINHLRDSWWKSDEEKVALFGKSAAAIRQEAVRRGISCCRPIRKKIAKSSGSTLNWTPERTAMLRKLNDEGLCRGDIAKILGTTEGSVNGKCRREEIVSVKPDPEGIEPERSYNVRIPLPPGSPESWGAITAGTVLEGCQYVGLE